MHRMGLRKKRNGKVWIARFTYRGVIHELSTGSRNKATAHGFERRIMAIREHAEAGQLLPDELVEWVCGLPEAKQDKLVTWGMVSTRRLQAHGPLSQHLEDWQAHLKTGRTTKHADQHFARVSAVVDLADCQALADLSGERVAAALGKLHVSKSTRNGYLRAVKDFAKWMVDHDRAVRMPAGLNLLKLEHIAPSDRVVQRRCATPAERDKLLKSPHATAYALALYQGLRLSEVRALRWSDLDLKHGTMSVWGKGKRVDAIPLFDAVRPYLGKPGTGAVTFMPKRGAQALRKDLGEPDTDLDFHCLRHTFCTDHAESGTTPYLLQRYARHSTIELTMKYYVHLNIGLADRKAIG